MTSAMTRFEAERRLEAYQETREAFADLTVDEYGSPEWGRRLRAYERAEADVVDLLALGVAARQQGGRPTRQSSGGAAGPVAA